MLGLIGSALNLSVPSPLTVQRDYEAYVRGPVGAITHAFGSVDGWRYGLEHVAAIAGFPEVTDSQVDDFGIIERGTVKVEIADAANTYLGLLTAWRNQKLDLELVTRLYREDGTSVELVKEVRGVVKQTSRKGITLGFDLADVDRSALDTLFPSKTYVTADWPELFQDHVNRPIPQGAGTVLKVPLTYLVKTGGLWKYGVGEVTGAMPTILALYRDRRLVSPAEYGTATQGVAGTTHFLATFAKEQVDDRGRLFELEADVLFPGSRIVSDELKRILQLDGSTVDSSFAAAAEYFAVQGIYIDVGYVRPRTRKAIIEDLVKLARGQLYRDQAGSWGLFVDRPRDPAYVGNNQIEQLEVSNFFYPEIPSKLTLRYRPSTSEKEEFTGKLTRTTTGTGKEEVIDAPFVREHVVADKVLCYLTKRQQARAAAEATVYGVQLKPSDILALEAPNSWAGTRLWASPGIQRPADRNELTLREYVPDVYVYTPQALPADATNTYMPDYSQTPPAAPTTPANISGGTSADTDGKVTAFIKLRSVPPGVNWQVLVVHVTDTTTGEIYQAELSLVAGNYEATVSGLRPNRAHTAVAFARNSDNLKGLVSAALAFVSANATTALAAPTVTVTQVQSREVKVELAAVADVAGQPKLRRYVLFEKVGGGSFAEVKRSEERTFIRTVSTGTSYEYIARSEDINGNESADSSVASITPAKMIDDTYVAGQGINGPSIGNGSINQGRSSTGTGSASGSFNGFPGARVQINMATYAFEPSVYAATLCYLTTGNSALGNDSGTVTIYDVNNGGAASTYDVRWRSFVA